MRLKDVFIGFSILLCALVYAQEKVQLLHKATKGQTMTHQLEGNFNIEVAAHKLSFEMKAVYETTVVDVSENEEITTEQSTSSYEVYVNGQKMPVPEQILKLRTITTIKPNGELVSTKIEGMDEETGRQMSLKRISQAYRIIYPANPVGVGDKWSYEYEENEELGTVAGVAEYELIGFETIKGVEAVRIKLSYQETGTGDKKMNLTGEVWVEKSSGSLVMGEFKIENAAFGMTMPGAEIPSISGTMRIERIAGSPLASPPVSSEQKVTPVDKEKEKEKEKKKEKTIEEIVKDYEKMEGIFTLYRKKEAGKDIIYMEIREDQLDKLFMLQVTASTGTAGFALVAGSPIDDIVFKFVRRDEQILFVVPNIQFFADKDKPIARAVKRSFADAYLEAFRVEAKSDERKSLLINVTDLFKSDIAQITRRAGATGGSYSIDKEKTAFNVVKVFPSNLFIQTAYHLSRTGGISGLPFSIPGLDLKAPLADPRSLPIVINYNLFSLPMDNGYRPRLVDPRVGYFYTEYQDFTEDKEDQKKRYILRWQIEKADPSAKLSPPKEPIVFWLDNAIPTEYREAVKRGLLVWNKAFERIGIKDAIVVKQMPDSAEFDHADMRYNVIRWVTSPSSGYAVALFRANPLTGQILNASITVDANMTRYTKLQFKRMIDPLSGLAETGQENSVFDPRQCNYAEEALPNAWLGWVAMNMIAGPNATKVTEQKFTEDFITEVVAHEMGHILGLRHNFIASTLHSLKELADGEKVRSVGVVSSVMDYNPFNIMALHAKDTEYWTTTIGLYDLWAIEYGYTPIIASSPEDEKPMLKRIASQCTQPGHAYQSDELADQFDPLVTRFDLSQDPIEYWELFLKDLNLLMKVIPNRVPKRGEHYWEFTKHFNGILNLYGRAAINVSRYIGGLHIRGNHRGDPKEQLPLVPVTFTDQKRALSLVRTYIFSKNAFNFPKSLYLKLAPNPFIDWTSFITGSYRQDAPVRDTISSIQRNVLNRLFNPTTLNRITNNEFKVSDSNLTLNLPTLFSVITDAIWEELKTNEPVDSLRRQLQRAYLQILVDMITKLDSTAPEDAKMLARYHLRQLKTMIQTTLPRLKDEYTKVHYSESLEMINKALEAKYILTQPAPPARPFSILDLLGQNR